MPINAKFEKVDGSNTGATIFVTCKSKTAGTGLGTSPDTNAVPLKVRLKVAARKGEAIIAKLDAATIAVAAKETATLQALSNATLRYASKPLQLTGEGESRYLRVERIGPMTIEVRFKLEKETKGSLRYREVDEKGEAIQQAWAKIGSLYLR